MSKVKACVVCVYLTVILIANVAHSAQGDVTIDFGGLCPQVVVTSGPPYYFLPNPGDYFDCASGGTTYFRITDKDAYNPNTPSADRAQILPASTGTNTDAADDTLKFLNFKIFAVTPTPSTMPQGYQITFWREHVQPPQTDGPGSTLPDIYYKTTTMGRIKRVLNNWIKMDPGYVTHPVGSAEKSLGTAKTYTVTAITCPGTPADCGVSLSTSGKWTETSDPTTWLTNNRVLRVKVSFKFQNGNANPTDSNSDWILLDTGAKINSQTNADPGQEECSEQYCNCSCDSFWKWLFAFTSSTSGSLAKNADQATTTAEKAARFAKENWDSLLQDLARGGGEYLASLATLWDIPIEDQAAFFALAQDQYRAQTEEGIVKRPELLTRLHERWANHSLLYAKTNVKAN